MEKNRIKIIITAVLCVVLVFVWANAFKVLAKKAKKKQKKVSSATISTPAVSTVPAIASREIQLADSYHGGVLDGLQSPQNGSLGLFRLAGNVYTCDVAFARLRLVFP